MTDTLREDLDQYCDDALAAEARAGLEEKLAGDEGLRRERQQLVVLHRLLVQDRLEVRPDFQARVMARLAEPAWAPRPALFVWHTPFAALLVFGVCGGLLLMGLGETPLLGVGGAFVDFFQTTVLAGAGMLASSWISLGMALEEFMAESILTFTLCFVSVLLLDIWVVSLLAPKQPLDTETAKTPSSSDPA